MVLAGWLVEMVVELLLIRGWLIGWLDKVVGLLLVDDCLVGGWVGIGWRLIGYLVEVVVVVCSWCLVGSLILWWLQLTNHLQPTNTSQTIT